MSEPLPEQQSRYGNSHQTHLFVFQPQQQNLFHHRKFRLLAALGALLHIPWVESDLVAILVVLVARLGTAVSYILGRVGSRRGGAALAFYEAAASPATSRQSRGHAGAVMMWRL